MNSIEEMVEQYVPVNTKERQIQELFTFMERLGYYQEEQILYNNRTKEFFTSWYFFNFSYPRFQTVSITTAIHLYNTTYWKADGKGYMGPGKSRLSTLTFPAQDVRAAREGKLFTQLKLQWNKKKREFECNTSKVAMQHPEYYNSIIVPLIKQERKNIYNGIRKSI